MHPFRYLALALLLPLVSPAATDAPPVARSIADIYRLRRTEPRRARTGFDLDCWVIFHVHETNGALETFDGTETRQIENRSPTSSKTLRFGDWIHVSGTDANGVTTCTNLTLLARDRPPPISDASVGQLLARRPDIRPVRLSGTIVDAEVDDVRIGLSALLGTQKDLSVVGEADNGEDAVTAALRLRPDIVIMDLMMPKKDGVEATRELHAQAPDIKIIILTSYSASDGIAHALEAGASGAIIKTADDNALITAIRKVSEGGRFISPKIQQLLRDSPPVPELTERQREIVASMARGLSNVDIAKQFGISPTVAREHITAILNKVGASNRTEAVAIALQKQLLKI